MTPLGMVHCEVHDRAALLVIDSPPAHPTGCGVRCCLAERLQAAGAAVAAACRRGQPACRQRLRRRLNAMPAVLLDLGGVVIDLEPSACFEHWGRAANVPARQIGRRWQVDDAYKAFETGAIDFADYVDHLTRSLQIDLPIEDWRSGWNALLGQPFAEIVALLPTVAGQLPMFCLSNTNAEHLAACRQRHGTVLANFAKVYASSEIGRRKPAAETYRHVADDMGLAPEDILFLDDSPENVAGALAAGMNAKHIAQPADTVRHLLAAINGTQHP